VQIQPVTPEIAASLALKDEKGALVASVASGSPAAKAGVLAGDVIVAVDGKALEHFKDLPRVIADTKPGTQVALTVMRQNQTQQLPVALGRLPADEQIASAADSQSNGQAHGAPKLGLELAALTPESRRRFGLSDDVQGVLVVRVAPGSPAEQAGIRAGSVITMVGQARVTAPEDLVKKVSEAAQQKRPGVLLLVQRDGEQAFIPVKFAA
jgi:serine protease Do